MAILVAAATYALLPDRTYRASAVVAVADPTSASAPTLLTAARDTVVSKPVMSRVAESLIASGFPVPGPSFIERLGVAFEWNGMQAVGRQARLSDALSAGLTTRRAEAPGSLDIVAENPDADLSARTATAAAKALVEAHDASILQARRQREIEAGEQMSRLKAAAVVARRRFVELGGNELDPAQVRAAAAAQVAAAQTRVDILHAIIASGTPPLGDRRDVSPSIDALQTTYLDLSRQLTKAQETLGDRHTTIISLREELKRAGASLTAEWKRLARLAEAELGLAKDRVKAASRAEAATGPNGRVTLGDARIAMQMADERVSRLEQALREVPEDERSYRLLAPAAVPSHAAGFSAWARLALAALAGLFAYVVARSPFSLKVLRSVRRPTTRPMMSAGDEGEIGQSLERAPAVATSPAARPKRVDGKSETVQAVLLDVDGVLRRLADLHPGVAGSVLTVLVGSNDEHRGTTDESLAIGRAAAATGKRVLIVETRRDDARLAAHAEADADPFVVDLFGTLRVALAAERGAGDLCLAPYFARGDQLASKLAAQRYTCLVEDIADDFDMLVIDGGVAAEAAAAGWSADAFVRVGARLSAGEDERFAEAFDVPTDLLIGTIVGARFVAAIQPDAPSRLKPAAAFSARVGERSSRARASAVSRSPVARVPAPRRSASGR